MPIEYEQRLFTKLPIDHLTNNILERFKVSLIKQLFDNIIYESNPTNEYFGDFPFDGNERLITIQRRYHIYDDIVLRLNNGLRVYV